MSLSGFSRRLLSVGGLFLALGLPAVALVESHLQANLSEGMAAVVLAVTPWLLVAWVLVVERRPLVSIGLHRPGWSTLGYGGAGILVNLAISVGVGAFNAHRGLHEADSELMTHLRQGAGWLLVLLVTNGACLTEIAFRGYTLERLLALTGGRLAWAASLQILLTTGLFIVSRGLGHGIVWCVDDVVFTAFYLWRRDLWVCLLAHGVPNFIASTLVATGIAA